jgi:hypothetical protein
MRTPTFGRRLGSVRLFCTCIYISFDLKLILILLDPRSIPLPSRPLQRLPRISFTQPHRARRFSDMPPKRKAQEETKGLNGTTDLPPADEHHTKVNAWSAPGPAAFDFRSTCCHHNQYLVHNPAHSQQAM